tara:strand:- start:1245 stop:2078 length:834 start_codon:yes stop_codon:yes gene_type:complete
LSSFGEVLSVNYTGDIFLLPAGALIKKRSLFDVVQFSKVAGSRFWSGSENIIFNTPQQGINWIGGFPACRGVIVKVRPGAYDHDGWGGAEKKFYNYSLKARNGVVSETEKANRVLINQPQYGYPIFLFSDDKDSWLYEGEFSVSELHAEYVVLERGRVKGDFLVAAQSELDYQEGGKRYVSHLMAERNRAVVQQVKDSNRDWCCDICGIRFADRYGVDYIEAHHKKPISTFSGPHSVTVSDFALVCPNCHRAVHILMRQNHSRYSDIKSELQMRASF